MLFWFFFLIKKNKINEIVWLFIRFELKCQFVIELYIKNNFETSNKLVSAKLELLIKNDLRRWMWTL